MNRPPLRVWLVTDGKPGHQNQSFGLADALGRLTPVHLETLAVPADRSPLQRLRHLLALGRDLPAPDLIAGAGHATHPALILLGRRHRAAVVVLMKPTLPAALFDLCLVPRHDLRGRKPGPNVIPTRGALHRVTPPPPGPRHDGLILVGGPSRQHGFDPATLLENIRAVVSRTPDLCWQLTDSRRTPASFLEALRSAKLPLAIFPHQQTSPGWVKERLAASRDAWVSEDSVSMVCEALGAACRVGILPMPRLKPSGRVIRGLLDLLDSGHATTFTDWEATGTLSTPPAPLLEADRCARIVLQRFFPTRLPASRP